MRLSVLTFAATLVAAAAGAQTTPPPNPDTSRTPLPYDRGYDKDDPRTRAINDAERPGVQAANQEALATAQAQGDAQAGEGVADQARYDADVAAYRQALRDRRATIAVDEAVAARNERAYARAMADWRAQVAACRVGNRKVCELPAPAPSAYW